MKIDTAIIGGGVAGLSAAIRLAELGTESLVIEAGVYPAHKICGEFLSPECLDQLSQWKILPVPITHANLRTTSNHLLFPFTSPAGGMSHVQLDPALAAHASSLGAKIKTNIRVTSFQPKMHKNDLHQIHLSDGDVIEASNVIIATGRIPNLTTDAPQAAYMGFKTHFDNSHSKIDSLEMFSFHGAYLGVSPVEDNKLNVACLADLRTVHDTDPLCFIEQLISKNVKLSALLANRENLFDHWMIGTVPPFGIKQTPDWHDAYFIGDAAVTVPPACGNGLSMAISGGRLAAEYLMRKQFNDFKKMWTLQCSSQLFWAKMLHKLMLNPNYGNTLIKLSNVFPSIGDKLFDLSRQKNLRGRHDH